MFRSSTSTSTATLEVSRCWLARARRRVAEALDALPRDRTLPELAGFLIEFKEETDLLLGPEQR